MAVLYKPSKYAFFTEGSSLVEPEFKNSCDINIMMRNVAKGLEVRGSSHPPQYGYDDTTIDGVRHRIMKAETEAQLQKLSREHEFEEKEFSLIPESVRKKFGFRLKKVQKTEPGPVNDDKTTKTQPVQKTEPIQTEIPLSTQTPPKAPG